VTKRGKKTAPKKRASAHPPHAELRAASPEAAQPMGPLLPEKKRPFWELVFSLAVAVLLFVANGALEPTVFGQQLKQMGARLLQVRLSDSSGWRGNPVSIVDISSMAPSSPASATGAMVVTNRCKLTKYLDQVASAGPTAIGVDVIFDPSPDGIVSGEDSKFLDHCLNLKGPRGGLIPVRVGIYSTLALGPDRWLGDPRFKCLGTSIIVPYEDEDHKSAPTGRMFRQVSFKVNNQTVKADSLSYNLFKIAKREATDLQVKRTPCWLCAQMKRIRCWLCAHKPTQYEKGHVKVEADTFPINFGLLQKLMKLDEGLKPDEGFRIKAEDIGSHRRALCNKIVLIGRATPGEAPDAFTTAASDEPIPGIYIHAAAVYTLMEAPLYELSEWVRYPIDFLLALAIFVIDRWLDHMVGSFFHDKVRTWLEVMVPAVLAVVVVVLGGFLVEHTSIYWTDFVVVALVLLIHKPFEAVCHSVWEVVQKSPRLLWRKT
jgi:hypothetical protein